MILLTLNAVFAAAFVIAGRNAARRGWPFVRHGWTLVQAHAGAPDARRNVERRRVIGEGGRFLIGGLLWLGAGAVELAAGVYFAVQTIRLLTA